MAAGTTQPDTVPGVEDLAVCGREEQDAGDWTAVGSEAWLLTIRDPAAADDPGGMLTTTAQWPSAGNAIATIFDDGISKRPKRPGGSYVRVTTVDFRPLKTSKLPL
jgi:hypothetical protein